MPTPEHGSPLEFDLEGFHSDRPSASGTGAGQPAVGAAAKSKIRLHLKNLKAKGGIVGAAASLALVLAKFAGIFKIVLIVLLKFPLFVTVGTMAVSIWLEALSFGWPLAIGIVSMIFIHECGHAWAARRLGRRTSGMIFIPFMGAAVFTRGGGTTVSQDAFVGIMGPIFGTAVGCIFLALFYVTKSPIFLELGALTFGINLFNLLPTPPLDGGWIVPVFSPKFMAIGMVLLIGVAFYNPFVLILAVMSLPRVIAAWKAVPESSSYFKASAKDRLLYGTLYIGLAIFLAFGQRLATGQLHAATLHLVM